MDNYSNVVSTEYMPPTPRLPKATILDVSPLWSERMKAQQQERLLAERVAKTK
jgi:hypothetical protein